MTCPLAGPAHACDAACVERERLFRRRSYRVVYAHFPQWLVFKSLVEREIEHDPSFESPQFVKVAAEVELPQVLVDDWRRVANAMGMQDWSVDRVISFLSVLGARTLCEQADRAAQG